MGDGIERRPDLSRTFDEKARQVEDLHGSEVIAAENFTDRAQWKLAEWVKVHTSCALQEAGKHCGDKVLVFGGGKLVGSGSAHGEEGLCEPTDQHRVVEQLEVIEEPKYDRVDDFVLCQVGKRLGSALRCT